MSKNVKIIIIVAIVALVIGLLAYYFYKKKKAAQGGPDGLPDNTAGRGSGNSGGRKVGNAATCGWLNATYPKLKTNEFSDIDGGAHNPASQVEWKKNNCDLMF
jgi:flagellar basal body-associated protein FliL